MSREPLPDEWRRAAEQKGVRASIRGIAERAQLSPETVRRLINGAGTSVATVQAVANLLFDGDANRVWELHGSGIVDHGAFDLPDVAVLLDSDQREAVMAVIRAMLPAEVRGGGAGERRARPDGGEVPPLRSVAHRSRSKSRETDS